MLADDERLWTIRESLRVSVFDISQRSGIVSKILKIELDEIAHMEYNLGNLKGACRHFSWNVNI